MQQVVELRCRLVLKLDATPPFGLGLQPGQLDFFRLEMAEIQILPKGEVGGGGREWSCSPQPALG